MDWMSLPRPPSANNDDRETPPATNEAATTSPYRSIRRRNPPELPSVPEEPRLTPWEESHARTWKVMEQFLKKGVRTPSIPLEETLRMLGGTEQDVSFFLRMCGASLSAPYNRWPLAYLTPDENMHWFQQLKGRPKINDVVNHLLHRGAILGLPRIECLEECGITFAVTGKVLIVDVDRHNSSQMDSFSRRVDAILSVLPFPHFTFMSSRSEGYHMYFPTAFLNRYVILDDDGTPHCHCDIRGKTYELTWETEVFADIAAEFKRLGLTDGLEIWPKGDTPLRLPMGPGSSLILPEGQQIESFAEVVAWLREFDNLNNAAYPSPYDILADLRQLARTAWSWETEAKVTIVSTPTRPPASPDQTHRPRTMQGSTRLRTSLPAHLRDGLTGPGMTNEWTMAIARHALATHRPNSSEVLGDLVWQLFEQHHNGNARIMNEGGPDAARSWTRSVAANLYQKWQSGAYEIRSSGVIGSRQNPAAALTEVDIRTAIQRIGPPPPGATRREVRNFLQFMRFVLDLLRCCKGKILARGEDITAAIHRVELPVQTIKGMASAGRDPSKPSYYKNRLALVERCGLLAPISEPSPGHCVGYRLDFTFIVERPVVANHDSWLGRFLGV